jgi:hypothetical protein
MKVNGTAVILFCKLIYCLLGLSARFARPSLIGVPSTYNPFFTILAL